MTVAGEPRPRSRKYADGHEACHTSASSADAPCARIGSTPSSAGRRAPSKMTTGHCGDRRTPGEADRLHLGRIHAVGWPTRRASARSARSRGDLDSDVTRVTFRGAAAGGARCARGEGFAPGRRCEPPVNSIERFRWVATGAETDDHHPQRRGRRRSCAWERRHRTYIAR